MRGPKNPRLRRGVVKASLSGDSFHLCRSSCAYQFTYQISASSLNYLLRYERGPKIQDGVAVVRMRHLVEKFSTLLKLLIISIHTCITLIYKTLLSSGGLRLTDPTGAPLLDPAARLSSPNPPLQNPKYGTVRL